MKDYELKKKLIEEKKDILFREINYNLHKLEKDHYKTKENMKKYYSYKKLLNENFNKEEERVATNLNHNRSRRRKLLKDRISIMLMSGNCYFLTLTFNDKYIEYKESSKKEYVKRLFKDLNLLYIANVDYGSKNGRVHYHAIVQSENPPDLSGWSYGFTNSKKIIYKNSGRLSSYIDKLSNHAIKNSTNNNYVIYSKKFKELENE